MASCSINYKGKEYANQAELDKALLEKEEAKKFDEIESLDDVFEGETEEGKSIDKLYTEALARVKNLHSAFKPQDTKSKDEEYKAKKEGKSTAFNKVDELQEAMLALENADKIMGIFKFVRWSKSQTKNLRGRMAKAAENGTLDEKLMRKMSDFSTAFDILNDIKLSIAAAHRDDPKGMTLERKEKFLNEIAKIISDRDRFQTDLLTAQREFFANFMADRDVQIEEQVKAQLSKKYDEIKPNEEKNAYIQRHMIDLAGEIRERSYQKYLQRAEKSIGDLGATESWLANEKNLSSRAIQASSRLIEMQENAIAKFSQNKAAVFDASHERYLKNVSSDSHLEDKYKGMYEVTESGRHYLISEYQAEFAEQQKEARRAKNDNDVMLEKYGEVEVNSDLEYTYEGKKRSIPVKGYKKNIRVEGRHLAYEYNGVTNKISLEEAIAANEYNIWKKENTIKVKTDKGERTMPSKGDNGTVDWRNKEYNSLSDSQRSQLSFLKSNALSADEDTGGADSLITRAASQTFIAFPTVMKSNMERIYAKDGKGLLKDNWESLYKLKDDDYDTAQGIGQASTDSIKVFVDVANREKLRVPIPFRDSRIKAEDQSLDLHSIFMMNSIQARNYKLKKEIEDTLLVILDVVETRSNDQYVGVGKKLKTHAAYKDKDLAISSPREEMSQESKVLFSIIKNRVYGILNEDAGEIAGVNIQKATSTFLRGSGIVSLVGNWANSIVNYNVGSLTNLLEAIGGEHYNLSDMKKAKKTYWKDIKSMLNDVGATVDTSETNLYMNVFNVMGDKQHVNSKFEASTRAKTLFTASSLRPIAKGGEHMMQAQVMYALMHSLKITNEKGQFINSEGKVVDKKDAASMHDAMYFEKRGVDGVEIMMKSWAKGNSFTGVGSHDKMMFELQNLIKKKIQDLHGQYDSDVQAMAQRSFWGKLLFFLRKWIEPGMYRRWRGIGKSRRSKDDLREIDKFFSDDLRSNQEGYYTTAVRFISMMGKSIRKMNFEAVKGHHAGLSPHEKANIKRVAAELAMIGILWLAYAALDNEDDDDENLLTKYIIRRQVSEMSFFLSPVEAYKVVQTPSAGMGMMNNVIKIMKQMSDPFELYEQGDKKGEYKMVSRVGKLLPNIRTIDDVKEAHSYLKNF